MTTAKYDAVIIGGGHNGLTCCAYLARAGKKVLVLERRPVIGGVSGIPGHNAAREILKDWKRLQRH